jgi:hypothetical protein
MQKQSKLRFFSLAGLTGSFGWRGEDVYRQVSLVIRAFSNLL